MEQEGNLVKRYCYAHFRSNDASFARGVLSLQAYNRGEKRSLISLQMCFMRWLYEVLATFTTLVTPLLHQLGILDASVIYFPDAILMSVAIPFANLMNDEETKGIISEENWYQGLRYTFCLLYTSPSPRD